MSTQDRFLRHMPRDGMGFKRKFNPWQFLHLDPVLLGALACTALLGLFELYSASGQHLDLTLKQMMSFGIGLTAMFVLAQIPPRTYQAFSPWFYAGGVGLLVAVALVGDVRMGAQRWLDIPGIGSVQPSEFMKLAMPMMVAWFLAARLLPPSFGVVVVTLVLIGIPWALIAEQPDLGTSILVAGAGFFVLFLAGLPWWLIGTAVGMFAALAPVAWTLLHDYQRQRIMTLFDPESDPLGTGWNILQSKTAIGSGGITGKGWLHGTQSHLEFLPEGHTDFIIAAYSEEFGLIGLTVLLLLYLVIIGRGLFIASTAQDTYSRLLAGAITLSFFVYVFVNMGMVSGILPVVGVPLPFVSYGGTAIITLLSGFGILMSIHTHKKLIG
ncbi:MAG: rod shape-determining protein RodA [Moraxellaceae bacterium]|jgi:rod shape determining protein RodA|nr:rod shape-determining protein RodA [Moraxellaceae bacterium]